ncbi:hypothetical protein AK812_SmicGene46403, partial [Symbiodinium microadriaticum]
MHLQAAVFYKKVDLEVTKEYVSTLQASTAFDHFMEVASQPEDAQVQALNQLGLSLPPGLNSNPNVSKEKALELYLAMVNKAAAKKVEQDRLAAKTTKEKEQLRDAIRAKDPKNLFESAVKQAIIDMSKQVVDPRVDYAQALASNENPINHIDWTKEAPSKRRFTKSELAKRKQAKAKGAHNTKDLAHKGKGKGKDAQKGKGKGYEVPDKGYAVIPTDKDGGYCLVPRGYLRDAHRDILQKSFESVVPIKLVKVDIKDYFMSGSPQALTEHGASMMAQPFQQVGMDVIGFLLSHQYVRSHLFTDQVWRVLVGAGMGLNFSGDLCDAAFYSMSESWFVHNQGLRDQTGILLYVRFRDDVFMILRDGLHMAFCEFMEKWREKAGCFKLVVEDISRSQLTVLDLNLEITKSVTADGQY